MKKTQGAFYMGEGRCRFRVWAPFVDQLSVEVVSPHEQSLEMSKNEEGYWSAIAANIDPGARYLYKINNDIVRPDPASFSQPDGVHKSSEIIDHSAFKWTDDGWRGIPPEEMITYELHTGTFTEQGNFKGIISKLDYLLALGINAIEIMPVASFPGSRNWGYDGVYPFAVQNSYGGPEGLKELVNTCHQAGIAVILDVVYNHFGPEGNYLHDYGPYFTDKYNTPWGKALNFDDAFCDQVRQYFISNACMWFHEYHIDALRLDAIHAIKDTGAKHFLRELAESIDELEAEDGRSYYLIAESDLNDIRVVQPHEKGGYGIDSQWSDDFHHALHALVTKEEKGYYEDFGEPEKLAKAYNDTFVYDWRFSNHRKKTFGSDATPVAPGQFVTCIQNHDQIGNRMLGERLSKLISFEMLKLSAGAALISPHAPLLFMGEEYGEKQPFQYFISHTDPNLVEAVRKGRKKEFSSFSWKGEVPDPQAVETFKACKLRWNINEKKESTLLSYYKLLIQYRKNLPALGSASNRSDVVASCHHHKSFLTIKRKHADQEIWCYLNFEKEKHELFLPAVKGKWKRLLDSADEKWLGPGASTEKTHEEEDEIIIQGESIVIFEKQTS